MRIRLSQNVMLGIARYTAGDVIDVSDEVARSLSNEGLAVVLEAPPAPTTATKNTAKATTKTAPKRTRKTVKA